MGAMHRAKGSRGELEIAAIIADLTGYTVKRRVRNHAGDSDLDGIPGWCVEVKRAAKPNIAAWWRQACAQAAYSGLIPVLFYRIDRRDWVAVWQLSTILGDWQEETGWTCESSVQAWAAVMREVEARQRERNAVAMGLTS